MRILLLLSILTSYFTFGQNYNFDITVEPKPYSTIEIENPAPGIVQRSLRCFTYSQNPTKTDTLSIDTFDKFGNKILQINFKKDGNGNTKPEYQTKTVYNKFGPTHKVTTFNDTKKQSITIWKYDNKGNQIELLEITLRNSDTTMIRCKKKVYDTDNNLIEKTLYASQSLKYLFDQYSQLAEFKYKDGLLIQHKHTNSGGSIFQPITKYTYTEKAIDSIVLNYQFKDSIAKGNYTYFKYNKNGNLIYREQPVAKDIRKMNFEYKNNFLISAMEMKNDRTLISCQYTYQNGLLKTLTAQSGSIIGASHLCYFSNPYISNVKKEYTWHSSGYLQEIKVFQNGKLYRTETYVFDLFNK